MRSILEEFCFGTNITPKQNEHYLDPRRPISRKEELDRLRSALEPLYWQAVRVRELGISYRGFRVGCAVYAFNANATRHEDRWGTFYGMNTKVEEGRRPVCAEPIAISGAYAAGYTKVLGILIVGEPQPDHHSGLFTPTLHPCHECRVFIRNHPIVPRHTRIITALPPVESSSEEELRYEIQTSNQILRLHGDL